MSVFDIINALNAEKIESKSTDINIVLADAGTFWTGCRLADSTVGLGDWIILTGACGSVTSDTAGGLLSAFATFTDVSLIPTLSHWSLIILGILLVLFGIVAVKNKRLA